MKAERDLRAALRENSFTTIINGASGDLNHPELTGVSRKLRVNCYSTTHMSPLLISFSRLPGPDLAMAASIWAVIMSS